MNFTNGNTFPSLGKRINWQLATIAGGLAVLIGAGALAGAFDRDGSPTTTAIGRPAEVPAASVPRTSSAADPTSNEVVYLVVGNEAQAAALRAAISTDAASDPALSSNLGATVVALETVEQEAAFETAIGLVSMELMADNTGVRVVDLRETRAPMTASGPAKAAVSGAAEPRHIVYLVGSPETAATIHAEYAATWNLLTESGSAPSETFTIVDVSTPEGMRSAEHINSLLLADDGSLGSLTVVDTRLAN